MQYSIVSVSVSTLVQVLFGVGLYQKLHRTTAGLSVHLWSGHDLHSRGVARIFQRGVTLCQTLSSWRFRHGIL